MQESLCTVSLKDHIPAHSEQRNNETNFLGNEGRVTPPCERGATATPSGTEGQLRLPARTQQVNRKARFPWSAGSLSGVPCPQVVSGPEANRGRTQHVSLNQCEERFQCLKTGHSEAHTRERNTHFIAHLQSAPAPAICFHSLTMFMLQNPGEPFPVELVGNVNLPRSQASTSCSNQKGLLH